MIKKLEQTNLEPAVLNLIKLITKSHTLFYVIDGDKLTGNIMNQQNIKMNYLIS